MPSTGVRRSAGPFEPGDPRIEKLEAVDHKLRSEMAWTTERDLLRAMIDQVPDYLFAKDLEGRFLILNKAVAEIHARERPDDIIGKTDFDLHSPELARKFFEIEQAVVESGLPMIDMEEAVVDAATGARKWLLTSKVALRNNKSEVIGLVGISRDVTARKKADLLREEQAFVLEMIAMNAPLAEILDRLVLLMETQLEGVIGSILLLDMEGTRLTHGAGAGLPEKYRKAIDGVAIGPRVGSCGTAAYLRQRVVVTDIARDPLWEDFRELAEQHGLRSCWSSPILSHRGAVLGTFALYTREVRGPSAVETHLTEMTTRIAAIAIERRRAQEQISFLAHHDPLTGLPNRSLLKDRLTQAMLQTQRHNPWVSVVFVDLDNFKTVNDSRGHSAGDTLLRVIAARMVACVRSTDTVVRLGGDEFVILLVDQTASADSISATLEKIRAAIAEPIPIEGQNFHVTCSMGVATFPNDGTDAETLLMNADAAMYKAKDAGRDGFRFYTAEMNTRAHERLDLQEALRAGLAASEFELFYQPQVDIRSWRIFAVEALIRWNHPTKGVIFPAHFIPLAEDTGQIVALGDWVLQEACRQNRAWQEAGLPNMNVSVNVSARQFHDRNWIDRVVRALGESGMSPRNLELELTESLLMRDVDGAIATMKELLAIGVRFAIDDFGTGYSSLSALKTLPVARLKIDRSFVRNLAHDHKDRGIAAAIISLGQRLDLRVIAEGVETDQQLDFLRENGCDEVQGYRFGKPMRSQAIEELIKEQDGAYPHTIRPV